MPPNSPSISTVPGYRIVRAGKRISQGPTVDNGLHGAAGTDRNQRMRSVAQQCDPAEGPLAQRITVVDVSEIGARIEHAFPLSTGSTSEVAFEYNGVRVAVECEVVRCKLDRSVLVGAPSYISGLRFVSPDDPSVGILLDMLRSMLKEDLSARRKLVSPRKAPAKKKGPAAKVARAKKK